MNGLERLPRGEFTVGIGSELEEWAGVDRSTPRVIYQTVLFEQLKTQLGERDRQIWFCFNRKLQARRMLPRHLA